MILRFLAASIAALALAAPVHAELRAVAPLSSATPSGAAGGDLAGSYPNPTVNGVANATNNIVTNANIVAKQGAVTAPVGVGSYSSTQLFTGSASNQPTIAFVDNSQTANKRIAYLQWAGNNLNIGFGNDAFSSGVVPLALSGNQSTGITGITMNTGSGSLAITGSVSATGTGTMPVYSNTGSAFTNQHMTVGASTLAAGAATVTFSGSGAFTSSTSYICMATDTSAAAAVKANPVSGTSLSLAGTGTDVIAYQCVGN